MLRLFKKREDSLIIPRQRLDPVSPFRICKLVLSLNELK
jgi:hypothetical protein